LFSLDGERTFVNALKITGFIAIGAVLIVSGLCYFRRAQEIADMMAGQLAVRPWQRLWLPARWYTSRKFFWQLRICAVLLMLSGVFLVLSASAALVYYR
jgi:hypothetical protein